MMSVPTFSRLSMAGKGVQGQKAGFSGAAARAQGCCCLQQKLGVGLHLAPERDHLQGKGRTKG